MFEFSMYSIGEGRFLREVFNGLAMITGTGDFTKAVMIGMLFAVIVTCFQAVLRGGREIAWQNILIGWILYACFFAVPSRVIIEDKYTGSDYTVDNVPLGAAVAGSMISKIGNGLTDLLETGYGIASRTDALPALYTLKYLMLLQHDGMSSLTMDALSKKTGVDIQATLSSYIKNCTVPALRYSSVDRNSAQNMNVRELMKMGSDNPNLGFAMFFWGNKRGTWQSYTCQKGYPELERMVFPALSNESVGSIINDRMRSQSVFDQGSYQMDLSPSTVFTDLNLSSQGQQDYMFATVIAPIYEKAYARFYNRNEAISDLMVAQAVEQRNVQWAAEQSLWTTVVHPLMTFFEGFVFAITPFAALLLCFGGFGLALIGKYIQTLFWISLWQPIMSICNLYIMLTVENLLANADVGSFTGLNEIAEVVPNQLATGGMLMTATPMLALMIVTGSTYAFTTLASRLNGGDHINEKIVAPDAASVGTVFEQQGWHYANRGAGHLDQGTAVNFSKISLGRAVKLATQSAWNKVKGAARATENAYNESKGVISKVTSSKEYGENLSSAIKETFSDLDEGTCSKITNLVTESGLSLKTAISAGIGFGVGRDKGKKESESAVQKVLKAAIEANVSGDGSLGSKYSVSDVGNFAKKLSTAMTNAFDKTRSSMKKDGVLKGWQDDKLNTFRDAYSTYSQATANYNQTASAENNASINTTMGSNEWGIEFAKEMRRGNQVLSEELGRAESLV